MSDQQPTLSIIVPTFNSGKTIIRCLQSIEQQLFKDYEVIIQDGNSSDETQSIVSDYQKTHPHLIIEFRRESDDGVYDAMNKAMERARGRWIYFLGSDDELYNQTSLLDILQNPNIEKADVIYGNVKMIEVGGSREDGYLYDGPFTLKKLLQRNICHQATLYRRELVTQIGPYSSDYKSYADWDYNLRCWARARFQYVDVIVAAFYKGGLSMDGDDQFCADMGARVIEYFGFTALHPLLNTREFKGWNGIEALQRRQSAAYHMFARLLRIPTRLFHLK